MQPTSNVASGLKTAVGRPTVLILAASNRAPAYEAQMRVLEEHAEDFEAQGVLVGCVLQEGESVLGSVRLDPPEAREILDRYAGDQPFQVVVLSKSGEEVHRSDAPLQGTVILRALGSEM